MAVAEQLDNKGLLSMFIALSLLNNGVDDFIYLHGFASGSQSAKAIYLRDRFAELDINLKVPDLNQGDFFNLTISRQLDRVAALFPATS